MALNTARADSQREQANDVVDLRVWKARQLLDGRDVDITTIRQVHDLLGQVLDEARPRRRGPPPRGGVSSRAELLVRVGRAARDLCRSGRRPTMALVAAEIGWSRGGLSRALKRHGIDWWLVRADADRRRY